MTRAKTGFTHGVERAYLGTLVYNQSRSAGPDLAVSLYNLSVQLADLEQRTQALATIDEATAMYRTLAERHPVVFGSDLADSLQLRDRLLHHAEAS